ncbi:hypothetical protein TNCV_1453431 [Trichonephila clavipes]|nr:hypothetical protein TNCV_1453431 [Trichonephila clavipes]
MANISNTCAKSFQVYTKPSERGKFCGSRYMRKLTQDKEFEISMITKEKNLGSPVFKDQSAKNRVEGSTTTSKLWSANIKENGMKTGLLTIVGC